MAHHDVNEEQEDDSRHNCESGDVLLAHVSLVLSGHLQFLLVYSSLFASFGAARKRDGRVELLGDADAHGAGCVQSAGLHVDFVFLEQHFLYVLQRIAGAVGLHHFVHASEVVGSILPSASQSQIVAGQYVAFCRFKEIGLAELPVGLGGFVLTPQSL